MKEMVIIFAWPCVCCGHAISTSIHHCVLRFEYLVYRHRIINVYNQEYESAGAFWPDIHGRITCRVTTNQNAYFSGFFYASSTALLMRFSGNVIVNASLYDIRKLLDVSSFNNQIGIAYASLIFFLIKQFICIAF
ncbi:hypothetical protein RYX36_009389 [Vicia faba]